MMRKVGGVDSNGSETWSRLRDLLRAEMGEAQFGSWLAKASVHPGRDGCACLVTPTGTARDWIRRNVWLRIGELWSEQDQGGRRLLLKSRAEYEATDGAAAPAAGPAAGTAAPVAARPIEIIDPISSDLPQVGGGAAGAGATVRMAGLRENLTFDTFVTGDTNEFAHAVARRVAQWSDGHFNPVVFHGPNGWGKTHLLNAIAWEAMRTAPDKRVVYLSAERFLSTFVRAVMDRGTAAFKERLREADLLLIDDVHFVGGKTSTQEELFHTLATLVGDGRRVVFTADRAPSQLAEIDARLRSHLGAGLVCGLEAGDHALRLGILERKLSALPSRGGRLTARPEVLRFLADRFGDTARDLEGALMTLAARAGADLAELPLEDAQTFLRLQLKGGERRVTIDEIQKATADHFGLKQADLVSDRRSRAVARPRQAAMWLSKQMTTRSLPDIGRRFGGRDHTTVLHAVRRIEELKQTDAQLARDLEQISRRLRG